MRVRRLSSSHSSHISHGKCVVIVACAGLTALLSDSCSRRASEAAAVTPPFVAGVRRRALPLRRGSVGHVVPAPEATSGCTAGAVPFIFGPRCPRPRLSAWPQGATAASRHPHIRQHAHARIATASATRDCRARLAPSHRLSPHLRRAAPDLCARACPCAGWWCAKIRSWRSCTRRGFMARGAALALPSHQIRGLGPTRDGNQAQPRAGALGNNYFRIRTPS